MYRSGNHIPQGQRSLRESRRNRRHTFGKAFLRVKASIEDEIEYKSKVYKTLVMVSRRLPEDDDADVRQKWKASSMLDS